MEKAIVNNSKAQSRAYEPTILEDTHQITVMVLHSPYTSHSRSVIPCAKKAMRNAFKKTNWYLDGYNGFDWKRNSVEGGSFLTFTFDKY